MPQRQSVGPSRVTPTLAGLPRPRPEPQRPAASRHAIQAIRDLRRLRPPIEFEPGAEAMLLKTVQLTRAACLVWLRIAKQFYGGPISAPEPARNIPPISFLNLLTDWIDVYARITNRRKKPPGWRWDALRGFVDRHRGLQSANFLRDISRLTKSLVAYFTNPRFDHPVLVLWQQWQHFHLRRQGFPFEVPETIEPRADAVRVFDTVRLVVKYGTVRPDTYMTLAPYLSKGFRPPLSILPLLNDRERKSFDEFIARAAALDVYVQYRQIMDESASDRNYLEDAAEWVLKLGEPDAQLQFERIHGRFCGCTRVDSERRLKKNVGRSGPRKLR
jgi:hypothetical protein